MDFTKKEVLGVTNDERYRRILETTKSLFLDELRAKCADIADTVERWRRGEAADDLLVERLYRHTHMLKGAALTLGFSGVDAIADAVRDYKHRHAERPLDKAELDRLAAKAMELEGYR